MDRNNIRPWREIGDRIPLQEYLDRGEQERTLFDRFGVWTEVQRFQKPDGTETEYFWANRQGPHMTTFVMLSHEGTSYVVVTAGFKPGIGVTVVPPSAVPRQEESMDACARMRTQQITGVCLDGVHHLSGKRGVQKAFWRYHEYIGILPRQTEFVERNPDDAAYLTVFVMPLPEWLGALDYRSNDRFVIEDCAITTTTAALRFMAIPPW